MVNPFRKQQIVCCLIWRKKKKQTWTDMNSDKQELLFSFLLQTHQTTGHSSYRLERCGAPWPRPKCVIECSLGEQYSMGNIGRRDCFEMTKHYLSLVLHGHECWSVTGGQRVGLCLVVRSFNSLQGTSAPTSIACGEESYREDQHKIRDANCSLCGFLFCQRNSFGGCEKAQNNSNLTQLTLSYQHAPY